MYIFYSKTLCMMEWVYGNYLGLSRKLNKSNYILKICHNKNNAVRLNTKAGTIGVISPYFSHSALIFNNTVI